MTRRVKLETTRKDFSLMSNASQTAKTLNSFSIEQVFIINNQTVDESLAFMKNLHIGDLTSVHDEVFTNFALANLKYIRSKFNYHLNQAENDFGDKVTYESLCISLFYILLDAWSKRIVISDASSLYIRNVDTNAWYLESTGFNKREICPYLFALIDGVIPGILSILGPDRVLTEFWNCLYRSNFNSVEEQNSYSMHLDSAV